MKVIANTVAFGTVASRFEEKIPGTSNYMVDALTFINKSFENLLGASSDQFIWAAARDEFVENFSRLLLKS